MLNRISLAIIAFLIGVCVMTTVAQELSYNFNGCVLQDLNGILAPVEPTTSDLCQCGVEGDGIVTNGNDLFYEMDEAFRNLASENEYTIRFAFLPQDETRVQALFSVMKDCSRDSMIALQYIPQSQEVEILVSRILGDSWTTRGALIPDRCWHEVAITKSNSLYSFYVDNIFIESFDNLIPFPISPESRTYLGYSPCVDEGTDNVFEGIIDQFNYTTSVLSAVDLQGLSIQADQIMNNDTTIIIGQSVQVLSGPSCAPIASWNPNTGIDDPNMISPMLSPTETTDYLRELTHNGCTATDSIRINVIDESTIDCADLILPNVFTPNGDNVNDIYNISNLFIIEELNSFEIFDRWGESVYFTSNKGEGWDGMFSGNPALLGMYVYRVSYTCQSSEQEVVGSFSLMR